MQEAIDPTVSGAVTLAPVSGKTRLIDWEARHREEPYALQPRIVACIDRSTMDCKVVAHAKMVADRLGGALALAQVLEPAGSLDGPQDPLRWGVLRHRCRERFDWVAAESALSSEPEQILLEGKAADQLSRWAVENDASLIALATHGEAWGTRAGLGSTAQRLVELAPTSLLLVPPVAPELPLYERLIVPLDGSCRAESVLPIVMALAKDRHTDVAIVHVVPQPQFTEVGPLEPEAIVLREQLIRRNEQVARTYIERVLRRLHLAGIQARPIIVHGDPRERLLQIATEEEGDLMVLAMQGQSGRADVACGSVASYLAGHAVMPLLVLRNEEVVRVHAPRHRHERGVTQPS
ncbi:MAG: universal stress protein [Sphingomonadales bacterium]